MGYNSPLLFDENTELEAINRYGTMSLTKPGLDGLAAFADGFKTQEGQTIVAAQNALPDIVTEDQEYPEFKQTEGEWGSFWQQAGKLTFDGAAYGAAVWAGLAASPFTLGTSAVAAPTAMKGLLSYRDFGVTKQEAMKRGVDENTANELGAVQAMQTFLLFDMKLPLANQINKLSSPALRIASRVGVAGATQIGLDYGGTETRAQILEDNGYNTGENAEWIRQMRQWDAKRIAADAIMGQLMGLPENFGEISRNNVKGDGSPITDDDYIGASATVSFDEAMHTSAPGIPTDARSAAAHIDAGMKAMDDIVNDRPVNVENVWGIHDATFLRERAPADVPEAEQILSDRNAMLEAETRQLQATEHNLAAAEDAGMTDLVEHFRNELTRRQANVERTRQLVDEAEGQLNFMRDPENTDYGYAIKRMQQEAQEWQLENEAKSAAYDFNQDVTEPPKTGKASMDAAQAMYENYKATAGTEGIHPWPEDMRALHEPSPTRQKLDDSMRELQAQYADDPAMQMELEKIAKSHTEESEEFRTYELLAQCAIENM